MNSEKKKIDFNDIKSEVKWFIDKVKGEVFNQGKNTVYAVKLYEGDSENQFCITMVYIEGSLLISHIIDFKYYTYIEGDLVLLDYNNVFKEKYELQNVTNIQQLTDKQIVINKIDQDLEAIGAFPGYICCFEEGNIKKVFYENSEEIPYDKAVFKFSPPAQGTLIEMDSSSFKQMLRDKEQKK